MPQRYEIVWSKRAERDVDRLLMHLSTLSKRAVTTFESDIRSLLARLEILPYSHAEYPDDPTGETREAPAGSYRIFYRVVESAEFVEIMHVRHSARQEPHLN